MLTCDTLVSLNEFRDRNLSLIAVAVKLAKKVIDFSGIKFKAGF